MIVLFVAFSIYHYFLKYQCQINLNHHFHVRLSVFYLGNSVAMRFPYLTKKNLREGQKIRRVAAQLDWNIIEEDCQRPFVASGVKFVPLPVSCSKTRFKGLHKKKKVQKYISSFLCFLMQVMHGEGYICLGFLFGEKSRVAYISDVSRIPASTEYGEYYLFILLGFLFYFLCIFYTIYDL